MKLAERLAIVRRFGPRSPTQRHLLGVLATYDDDEGRFVWPGNKRLADETGYTGRCITATLADLVRGGWLKPEKQPQQSRPSGRAGSEAWWAHGNLGGRKNSTRYRIVYRVETLNDVPDKPGTRFRDRNSGQVETLNDVPPTLNDVPDNPEPRSGDPVSIRNDPREGDTPSPIPPPGMEASPDGDALAGAGAPGLPAAARHAIQAEMKRGGCAIIDNRSLADWEAIAAEVGVMQPDQVPRMVYDLANAYRTHWKRPPVRPYAAADLAPFIPHAARQRAVLNAFASRIRA